MLAVSPQLVLNIRICRASDTGCLGKDFLYRHGATVKKPPSLTSSPNERLVGAALWKTVPSTQLQRLLKGNVGADDPCRVSDISRNGSVLLPKMFKQDSNLASVLSNEEGLYSSSLAKNMPCMQSTLGALSLAFPAEGSQAGGGVTDRSLRPWSLLTELTNWPSESW